MSAQKTERNKKICYWHYVDGKSSYAIVDLVREQFGESLRQPTVWKIIKRDAVKYGYSGETHES